MKYAMIDYLKQKPFWLLLGVVLVAQTVSAQQIDINRVKRMPNMPSPYHMRNWKQVTMGYDSLVFDFTQTGEYLPLIGSEINE